MIFLEGGGGGPDPQSPHLDPPMIWDLPLNMVGKNNNLESEPVCKSLLVVIE